jgi:hypothetical protein
LKKGSRHSGDGLFEKYCSEQSTECGVPDDQVWIINFKLKIFGIESISQIKIFFSLHALPFAHCSSRFASEAPNLAIFRNQHEYHTT